MRDASSKPSHYDHNPLFRSFFQANINRFGSHSYDRTRHLHDFVERLGCRFQLPFGRRPFWGHLLAAVAVPTRSGVVLEQQMFFPNDGSAAAFSWQLHAQSPLRARLTIKPFFSGCGPRSYRDVGFRLEAEQEGGRLTWLPNVRGPKVIADTNGEYHNEPTRFIESSRDQETASASSENLVTPGTFEFDLSNRLSVLIFSMEGPAKTQRDQQVGTFLAGLMRDDIPSKADFVDSPGPDVETDAQLVAA